MERTCYSNNTAEISKKNPLANGYVNKIKQNCLHEYFNTCLNNIKASFKQWRKSRRLSSDKKGYVYEWKFAGTTTQEYCKFKTSINITNIKSY